MATATIDGAASGTDAAARREIKQGDGKADAIYDELAEMMYERSR